MGGLPTLVLGQGLCVLPKHHGIMNSRGSLLMGESGLKNTDFISKPSGSSRNLVLQKDACWSDGDLFLFLITTAPPILL